MPRPIAEVALVLLVEVEARLERKAIPAQTDWPRTWAYCREAHVAHRTGAGKLYRARRAAILNTRRRRGVPSKHVNANTFPATNLRASSAFIICPANSGAITAPAVTAPNTKRASML
jgi:hypothetical protein